MFGVPFECNEPLGPDDIGRCINAVSAGTQILSNRGAILKRLHYARGVLRLIPDTGSELVYILKRDCSGCPD